MNTVGVLAITSSTVLAQSSGTARPTTTVTISKGEVAPPLAMTPWQLTPAQFRADLEPVPLPTTCTGAFDRSEITTVSIKADLYRPGMITPDSAKFLALCAIPGQLTSGEMHEQDGRTMYEVSLIPERRSTNAKVIIDANTGAVLSSKTYGGLRGLAGYLRESVERDENKNRPQPVGAHPTPTQPPPGVICTLEARPALQVSLEGENGAPLPTLDGVKVIARSAGYADTAVVLPGMTSFSLAHERPGMYEIEIRAPGYTSAVLSGVDVGRSTVGCLVATRLLTAQLKR
jgi:hypothetical protein